MYDRLVISGQEPSLGTREAVTVADIIGHNLLAALSYSHNAQWQLQPENCAYSGLAGLTRAASRVRTCSKIDGGSCSWLPADPVPAIFCTVQGQMGHSEWCTPGETF